MSFSKIKTDKLNKVDVFLAFYTRNKTVKQKIISKFGYPISSAGLVIGDYIYQIRYGFSTVQKLKVSERNPKNYLFINTRFKIKNLKKGWEKKILMQKARGFGTLYLRLRCVKSLKDILSQLPKKWQYRFGDFLPSIYLKRRKNEKRH